MGLVPTMGSDDGYMKRLPCRGEIRMGVPCVHQRLEPLILDDGQWNATPQISPSSTKLMTDRTSSTFAPSWTPAAVLLALSAGSFHGRLCGARSEGAL